MKVLLFAPHFPREQNDFCRGLAEVGAEVYGVADCPEHELPPLVRRSLAGYIRVPALLDTQLCLRSVLPIAERIRPDRIETLWENLVVMAAQLREMLGVPGMDVETAIGFRDKDVMRARAHKAGLRVPKWARVTTAKQVHEAAEEIGFPFIIKPIAGAGSKDTYRVNDKNDLEIVLPLMRHIPEANIEEFVDGEEFTYDTICINGKPVFENVAQYFPRPLDYRTHEWISPAQVVYRNPLAMPELAGGIDLGRKILRALNMGTGFTHMEWYKKPNGEVVFGEIGARNGGGNFVDQMNWANDFDAYREWARTVCWGVYEGNPRRAYHCGLVFKRAHGHGIIRAHEGVRELYQRYGRWIVHNELLPPGAHRRDWRMTLVSDGFVAFRHPQLEAVHEIMRFVVGNVHLHAS